MALPENVLRIIQKAAADHPTDIDRAVSQAVREVRRLPDYDEFVDNLVRHCIKEQVHEARHRTNVRIKRESNIYQQTHRPSPSGSKVVDRVYQSVYEFRIAGTTLGELRGADLLTIEENETGLANGHLFRARLCKWLREQRIPEDKRVRDVVPERKLAQFFEGLRNELGGRG